MNCESSKSLFANKFISRLYKYEGAAEADDM
jgi:hypothetical protein